MDSWVRNCSEFNAGYAADGYTRINWMSAIITTFGVGELSAVPAVTKICYATYLNVGIKIVLQRLLDTIDFQKIGSSQAVLARTKVPQSVNNEVDFMECKGQDTTQNWFWNHIGICCKEKMCGTSSFGIMDIRFPKGVTAITQMLWGSIGFSVGARQGAALAVAESDRPSRRVILFVRDGSFQITGNEVSTMIRHGLKPIIIVINNDGYTIERPIHGPEKSYNDIQPWKYRKLLKAFGGKQRRV
ncbi:Pyruvate decarboxylase 1 [Arthrobotrys conoides]|uniref:Pyruvate decarboxylase n=1 Tax=Arthrobotrys conoides TaxID=74498 RepID=A0AAN8NLQ9_9PEZI